MGLLSQFRVERRIDSYSASVPAGVTIYAVGDIHGRSELLGSLAASIAVDSSSTADDVLTVFLGDYVDRGLESAQVIERLSTGNFPTPFVALRGNHEAALLDFLENPQILDKWRHWGGLETLMSYGVDVTEARRGRDFETVQAKFRSVLPAHHLQFFRDTVLSYSVGDYFFCHAGVRPRVPLDAQSEKDLLWIRDEFLAYTKGFERVIVHGHTPVPEVEFLSHRINVDTGAYVSGKLSCVALTGFERRLLTS